MADKYDIQELIKQHALFDEKQNEKVNATRIKVMDELWDKMIFSASNGRCEVVYEIGVHRKGHHNKDVYDLLEFLRYKLTKLGKFKVEHEIMHGSNCLDGGCHEKEGCASFVKVSWNRDDLQH